MGKTSGLLVVQWPWNKLADILQRTFSNAFPWKKMFVYAYSTLKFVLDSPSGKFCNALNIHPTMHHFVTEMCTHVQISVTKWCIIGYGICATGESTLTLFHKILLIRHLTTSTIALVATVICWPYPTLNEFYLIFFILTSDVKTSHYSISMFTKITDIFRRQWENTFMMKLRLYCIRAWWVLC